MTTSVFKQVNYTLDQLLSGVKLGTIGLPDIQRPFVWKPVRVRDLLDSMYQGYPVGHLLLWENPSTDGKGVGADAKQKTPETLILDGQQRLTSLFSIIHGAEVRDSDYKSYRIKIAFNPLKQTFEVPDAATRKNPEFIDDISTIWTGSEGGFAFTTNFLAELSKHRELSAEDRRMIAENISRLENLSKYPFIALELSANLSEERAAEVFVRTNSEGITLNQADFILTLLSVFQEKLRVELETFCMAAKSPAISGPSPFNYFIQPSPDQLLRVDAGVAFLRGRLRHVYTMLRGKDMETGDTSVEIRERQFAQLAKAQQQVLDLTSWSEFHKAIMAAGYASKDVISSENAILYSYVLFLLGRNRFELGHNELRRIIARWFFMSAIKGYYTNSPESVIEADLAKLRDLKTSEQFVEVLNEQISSELTSDYWNITLPNDLATSSGRSPSLFAYYAALQLLNADVLYSTLSVKSLLDPSIKGKKSAVEKHHLFPRAYLEKEGVQQLTSINQIANFTLVEWQDNIEISDKPPSYYAPRHETSFQNMYGISRLQQQHSDHGLPEDWWLLSYDEFLSRRRQLMAAVVRRGFETI